MGTVLVADRPAVNLTSIGSGNMSARYPRIADRIKGAHMERLVAQPPSGNEAAYIFVILQAAAAAFGGKAARFQR